LSLHSKSHRGATREAQLQAESAHLGIVLLAMRSVS
jgi:hypothetical protein